MEGGIDFKPEDYNLPYEGETYEDYDYDGLITAKDQLINSFNDGTTNPEEINSRISYIDYLILKRGKEITATDKNDDGKVTLKSKNGTSYEVGAIQFTDGQMTNTLRKAKVSNLNNLFTKSGDIDKRKVKAFTEFRKVITDYLGMVLN